MGVDFISGKTTHFQKGWDLASVALSTPDLFRQQPVGQARQMQGELLPGCAALVGEALLVRLIEDCKVLAYRLDVAIVAFATPPAEIVETLRAHRGMSVAVVDHVGLFGGMVRVSFNEPI